MTINVPLLRKTLEHIEAHPEEWNQSAWACGTAGCFAWHAAMLDGAGNPPDPFNQEYVPAEPGDDPDQLVEIASTQTVHVADRATRVLGLDSRVVESSGGLFRYDNTLDDLRRIVADLTAEAVVEE